MAFTAEDYKTYTEVDEATDSIDVVSDSQVDFDADLDEDDYLYYDYGVAHFDDFNHTFDFIYADIDSGFGGIWALSNDLGNIRYWQDNSKTAVVVFPYYTPRLYLREYHAGNEYNDFIVIAESTTYYLLVVKSGTSLDVRVWTNSGDRDNDDVGAGSYVGALGLTLQADHSFRYVYGVVGYDSNLPSRECSISCYNLDLGEDVDPVNVSLIISDMLDSDNLYAQYSGGFLLQYSGYHDDGYAEVVDVLVNITQSGTVRACFQFTVIGTSFSKESGEWDLISGSCSYTLSGIWVNLTFCVNPQWDAIEEADVDLVAVISTAGGSDTDTMQTNYADVVTNLVVDPLNCDDDRGSLGQTIVFTGVVYYANNPSSSTATTFYPPDAEFTAVHIYDSGNNDEGSDGTVVNGAFSVSFAAPGAVGLDTYNTFIDMADADYPDAEEAAPTDTFISDRIQLVTLASNDTALYVGEYTEIRATAQRDYDDSALGVGDSLTVEGLALSWDAINSWFDGSETYAEETHKTYDEGSGSEATFGITSYDQNSLSVLVEWFAAGDEEGVRRQWFAGNIVATLILLPCLLFILIAILIIWRRRK